MVTDSNNQFAPPKSLVADRTLPRAADATMASRRARLGASCLDSLILGLPFAPAYARALSSGVVAAELARGSLRSADVFTALAATGAMFWGGLLVFAILAIVTAVLVYRSGQTIGKRLVGIKVVRTDGARATFARIFWLRNVVNGLLGWIPLVGSLYVLVDLCWIFGGARRCLHDYIADTIVVGA